MGAERPCRVAVADDNEAFRVLLGTMISLEAGLELVGEAGDGVDALELAEHQRPDVLVLDFAMPGMDGLEVLGRLAGSCPDVRVIVYTGHDSAELKATALELGAVDCLDKGGSPDYLIERVRRTCE
jgi:DNA-binding NarL/FixJ family response regulator